MNRGIRYFSIAVSMIFILASGFVFYLAMFGISSSMPEVRFSFFVTSGLFATIGILFTWLHTQKDKKEEVYHTLSCGHGPITLAILDRLNDSDIRSLAQSLHIHGLTVAQIPHIAPYVSSTSEALVLDRCPRCRDYTNQYIQERMNTVRKNNL